MKQFTFDRLNIYPMNHGNDIEVSIVYRLTGKLVKVSNKPFYMEADCLWYQIKSARATICNGLDLDEHLKKDVATEYIYGTKQGIAYIMSKEQWKRFCETFGTITHESTKNNGTSKIRLKHESKALLEWLQTT